MTGCQPLRVERAAITQHSEKDAGEFVRGGGDGEENRVWHEDGENNHRAQSGCERRWWRRCARHSPAGSAPYGYSKGFAARRQSAVRKGKRVICGPTSLKKVSTLWALMPGMVVKSTPRMRGASRRGHRRGADCLELCIWWREPPRIALGNRSLRAFARCVGRTRQSESENAGRSPRPVAGKRDAQHGNRPPDFKPLGGWL